MDAYARSACDAAGDPASRNTQHHLPALRSADGDRGDADHASAWRGGVTMSGSGDRP